MDGPPPADIRTEGLAKVYPGAVRAVDRLDLEVRPGEIFGLLGPNGAGKTTTVGMLTTRIVPTAGRALVGGVDVVRSPAQARRVLGVVSQGNTLDRGLNVRENLVFHGRYFGMGARAAREATDRWLEVFRLAHRAGARLEELSGGMARRLMLARAMLHGPPILFLDEPTAGLDPQSRLALWDLVEELHAAGQTILLTTHHMEEAEQFCQRVAVMDHGRILALDTPEGLKRAHGGGGTTIVLRPAREDARLSEHLARAGAVRGGDGSVRLRLGHAGGRVGALIDAAERCGFRVASVTASEATLETVFIALTGRELRE